MSALRRSLLAGLTAALAWLLVIAASGGLAAAQAGARPLAAQSLRPYAHVFIAYALAWLLVIGWAWSIARRLGKLERRLER